MHGRLYAYDYNSVLASGVHINHRLAIIYPVS